MLKLRKTSGRREVVFRRLDEIMPEVERLLVGHRTVGRWTLAQILNHLAHSIRFSIEGFPGRRAPWLVQATFGRVARWSILRRGKIPEGAPLPRRYSPQPGLDAAKETQALREALAAFAACEMPVAHPLVGAMTKPEWTTYHCTHCAHHLSFTAIAASE